METEGLGFYLSFHKYGLHLGESVRKLEALAVGLVGCN